MTYINLIHNLLIQWISVPTIKAIPSVMLKKFKFILKLEKWPFIIGMCDIISDPDDVIEIISYLESTCINKY